MKASAKTKKAAAPPVTKHRWLFRILALVIVPCLFLALLEGALRLAGYGYSTNLFDKVRLDNVDYLVANENFSLRFFPPALMRWPDPVKIEAEKPAGTYRIFVFGESAAQGDPAPAFAASRYLEVLLRERYPGVKFEMVNLGITAISSHVIVPMARECARCEGDLWIVYMGNNEMIGPFGAATVFGAKAPPWPIVRLTVALQKTRLGQLLMNVARKARSGGSGPQEWHGLSMFMGNQLPVDDPRKEVVYNNFQRNLEDIVRAGRRSGAAVMLNTVAVNLKDCPPFASLNSATLSSPDREKFDSLCSAGRGAELAGNWKEAADDFAAAIAIDPKMAEAQFREGECLLKLNNAGGALEHFKAARDCDALVFRADSRINNIVRDTAQKMDGPGVALCDAAASLVGPGQIPGEEEFYEHVHLNFDGNYRLARLWAEQAERLLPDDVKTKAKGDWASQAVCEARLGLTDWNRGDIFNEVRRRLQGPPFDSQIDSAQRIAAWDAAITRIYHPNDLAARKRARALYDDAIARAPGDYRLRENYGEFLELTGDIQGAAREWKASAELVPRNPFAFLTEGQLLEKLGDLPGARAAFAQAAALHPRYAEAWLELGRLEASDGKLDQAMKYYGRAAEFQPNDPQAFLCMGKALSLLKKPDESLRAFRHALDLDGSSWEAHYALGGELGMIGKIAEAKGEFQEVVRLQPQYAMGHLNLGVALLKLNDPDGARREFTETLRLDPGNQAARNALRAVGK